MKNLFGLRPILKRVPNDAPDTPPDLCYLCAPDCTGVGGTGRRRSSELRETRGVQRRARG